MAGKTQDDQPPPVSPVPTPGGKIESSPAAVVVNAADHPSLQAAVDALPVSGGVVRIPPGIYDLQEPVVIRTGDTRIEGAGTATWIRNLNESGEPALFIRPEEAATDRRARLWRVEVCGLRVTGNRKSGVGIQATAVQEIIVRNATVDRHGSHGVLMNRCEENARVIGCNFTYNNGYGLRMEGGHDMIVSANQFEENIHGISVTDAFNLTFSGNNVDDHLQNGVVIENTYGSVVSGNMIEECEGTAIILDRECYGITLSSNVIAHHLQGGIDLQNAWGCTVTGNNFVLVHEFSVRVGSKAGRHTITGNQFTNSYTGDGKVRRKLEHQNPLQLDVGSGIVLEKTEDIVVNGNQFSGISTHAVKADDSCKRLLITNNLITDHGQRLPPETDPIHIGAATESIVGTNLIGPQTSRKIESTK
ncbi:MAG TPA: right-handed parallel beta-helix repeat-containing protein [Planctomicrobium sp.]|nr:right-handed parallel beta-helix repeat-containing protein [Planctomicrobium sp.]